MKKCFKRIVCLTVIVLVGVGFTSCEKNPEYIIIDGHEFVDLGLPSGLKWATCNVGANSPEEYGNYYAWGETSTKNKYSYDNYSLRYNEIISDISGDPAFDVANRKWGSSCRMPTRAEIQELIEKCIWQYIPQNGVSGYIVTGPNGNSIFFPAAGFYYGTLQDSPGHSGAYWSSTPDDEIFAYSLYFYKNDIYEVSRHGVSDGCSVRPVSE